MNNKIHPNPNLQAKSEENKEMKIPIKLIQIQDTYNKANLELQHNFNLEIFKKQKTLTITITIVTAACSIVAGIVGAIFGYFLNCTQQQTKQETKMQTPITQPQNIVADQKGTVQSHSIKTKQSAQGESSSKDLLKKP